MRRAVVAVMAVGALTAAVACEADGDRKGVIVLPGMHDSVPYDAYDDHPVIGQTLRRPPEGTVPHGARRHHYGAGADEAERAGRELRNPIVPSEEALERGKVVFDTFCAVCHGDGGLGDGPIIGRFPNPPSLLAPRTLGLPDGQLFHVITHGSGIMASYAAQVPIDDRWRVVHYIRQLQGQTPSDPGGGERPPPSPAPSESEAQP